MQDNVNLVSSTTQQLGPSYLDIRTRKMKALKKISNIGLGLITQTNIPGAYLAFGLESEISEDFA